MWRKCPETPFSPVTEAFNAGVLKYKLSRHQMAKQKDPTNAAKDCVDFFLAEKTHLPSSCFRPWLTTSGLQPVIMIPNAAQRNVERSPLTYAETRTSRYEERMRNGNASGKQTRHLPSFGPETQPVPMFSLKIVLSSSSSWFTKQRRLLWSQNRNINKNLPEITVTQLPAYFFL